MEVSGRRENHGSTINMVAGYGLDDRGVGVRVAEVS
jgi:hypothetical protein